MKRVMITLDVVEKPLPAGKSFAFYEAVVKPTGTTNAVSVRDPQPTLIFDALPFGDHELTIRSVANDGTDLVSPVVGRVVVPNESGSEPKTFMAAAGFTVTVA